MKYVPFLTALVLVIVVAVGGNYLRQSNHGVSPEYPLSANTVCDTHMRAVLIDGDPHCVVLNHPEATCPTDSVLVVHDQQLACANGNVTDLKGNPIPGYPTTGGPKSSTITS